MTQPVPPTYELNEFQRTYFDFLRERLGLGSDEELAQLVMSKGLFALMREQKDPIASPTEKRAMAPKPLPTQYRIILEPGELTVLEKIYEVQPWWRDPLELLHMIIREGLKSMNRAGASKRDPTEPTRSEMEVSREQDAARLQRSAQTKSPVLALLDKLDATARMKRARHKEREGDVSLEDRVRKKLTKFLAQHPETMSKKEARKLLADLGER